jgi:hypothetical protein
MSHRRPYARRESRLVGANLSSNPTEPVDPRAPSCGSHVEQVFHFDHSFWSLSHDGPHGIPFAGQQEVFLALGEQALDHVFDGHNACIIAFGKCLYQSVLTPDEVLFLVPFPGQTPEFCLVLTFEGIAPLACYLLAFFYAPVSHSSLTECSFRRRMFCYSTLF